MDGGPIKGYGSQYSFATDSLKLVQPDWLNELLKKKFKKKPDWLPSFTLHRVGSQSSIESLKRRYPSTYLIKEP